MNLSELKQYIEQGLSTYEISKATNKSQTNVRHWLKKYGLKTQNLSFSQGYALKEKIIENGIEYRICSKCKNKKELVLNFYKPSPKKFYYWCKSCINKNTIAVQQDKKIQALNYKGGKCIKCGYNKYAGALDFHHLDPSKKDFAISRRKNCSLETIKSELDKCILLCRNCHAETHFEERCKRTE